MKKLLCVLTVGLLLLTSSCALRIGTISPAESTYVQSPVTSARETTDAITSPDTDASSESTGEDTIAPSTTDTESEPSPDGTETETDATGLLHFDDSTVKNDPVSREDMAGVDACKSAVVVIQVTTATGSATGTGIVLTSDGYIATNHHVIEDATKIRITFFDGSHAYATVIGSSAPDDLAVIKVDKTGLSVATFADSTQCFVGQTVYAIGTPAGSDFSWTTTKGIVSYVNREVKQYNSDGTMAKKLRLLQTDADVNPGNSGGPLVDADGRVIGIVSSKLAGDYQGIGFAIPSDGAMEILEAIIRYGNADSVNSSLSFRRPVLGIIGVYVEKDHTYLMENIAGRLYDVTEEDVAAMREEILLAGGDPSDPFTPQASGVLVVSVTEGLGADGVLLPDDIITAVNGVEFDLMNQMMEEINAHYAGDTVTLDVFRDGQILCLDIILSAQPD